MKIVLIDEVDNLGIAGDVRDVKDGYGRNYLIPQNLAVLATKGELARAESRRKVEVERRTRLNSQVEDVIDELQGQPVVLEVRVGPAGRLYGSVTASDIAEVVGQRVGQELDRRAVNLPQPIREVGDSEVRVRLAPDVFATLTVSVQPEGGLPPAEDAAAETDQDQELTVEEAIAAEEQRLAEETAAQQDDAPTSERQGPPAEAGAANDATSAEDTAAADESGSSGGPESRERSED